MELWVISDLHLNPQSPDRNDKFLRFLGEAKATKKRVLILGDLFDLWFGWKGLQFEYQDDILFKMNDLASSGLHIDYVEGNRDFGIRLLKGRIFKEVFEAGAEIRWGDRRIYAEHGDLINRADKQYRFFRKITKNAITYFLLGHLPAPLLLGISNRLEKSLKNTNQKYRIHYPESACEEFRHHAFEGGADIVLAGHFHDERKVKQQLNSRIVLFYNLPGWESGFRYLIIPQSQEEPYFKDFEE